jgi:hypothetical protein
MPLQPSPVGTSGKDDFDGNDCLPWCRSAPGHGSRLSEAATHAARAPRHIKISPTRARRSGRLAELEHVPQGAARPFDDGGRFGREPVVHRPLDHPRTPRPEPRRFPQARLHRPPCTPSPPCQRRDETGSCQRYPHEFTGIHRKLSPAVDNLFRSYAQMWTRPGETDVDRHRESPSSPQPVETCGLPVEGSGDDEAVASQRYPQAWG